MKNYISFIDDHSGSMSSIAKMALIDSNANMQAIADAAAREKLDTIVSQIAIGYPGGRQVTRLHTISNPNVLKPAVSWPCPGGTPLYDGIWNAIELHESLPDYSAQDVSFIVYITTDGQEYDSVRKDANVLKSKIEALQRTGRWTFVARMPQGCRGYATRIGIPDGNILEWETTEAGLQTAMAATQAATASFYTARSAGTKSTTSFYTNAAAVNTTALKDISSEVSLYLVPATAGRLRIDDFILQHRKTYLKGAAFYQLVKTEARIGPKKIVLVRERATGRVYAGKEARQMIGMPTDPTSNARVHPGDHGNYDIFIQSESLNRLLPSGSGVLYWEKQGVPFTQADIEQFAPKAPAVPVLPAVVGRTKPTPSPVPKAAPAPQTAAAVAVATPSVKVSVGGIQWFANRDDARAFARTNGKIVYGERRQGIPQTRGPKGERWFVYL